MTIAKAIDPRCRTLISYHEAGHAVVAMAGNWYVGQHIELDPGDRPDLSGVHRVKCSPWDFESPWQRLEIATGGFIVTAAGWLAERRLLAVTGWDEKHGGFFGYNYDNGDPAWDCFFNSDGNGQTDPTAAIDWLSKAAETLGVSAPTMAMEREIQAAAANMVMLCWSEIEDLASELDRTGKVEDLRRYWAKGTMGTVEKLCGKWARRFAHRHPEARDLADEWRDA